MCVCVYEDVRVCVCVRMNVCKDEGSIKQCRLMF